MGGRHSLVSDIPAGDRKIANLFNSVMNEFGEDYLDLTCGSSPGEAEGCEGVW
jgi:hypothetical protein